MYIALASASSDAEINRPLLERIAEALEFQSHVHYAPFWQSAGVQVRVFSSVETIPNDNEASPLVVFDEPDQAKTLGWHSVSPVGRPYGRVFWKAIRRNNGTGISGPVSLSATLSHEALEMVGDPYVSWWADTDEGAVQECMELCDRVEMDSYDIEGVSVSNFLGPRAFRSGDGPYDWLRLLESPWEIRPGGYAIRRLGSRIYDLWGDKYPEWKKEIKRAAGSRTARRGG